ncbi:hypothetical protein DUI87_19876 [Hirundo rustica rustica]|uniref:Adiponectin receptor protein 2 n=1 Tax=Hirundo rustica rustica TaxID=333673 RepID=A0A3M0JNU2_HIRRU|nr:hypothetical protein DUI87_19876 [Hirundo rustica rustica]
MNEPTELDNAGSPEPALRLRKGHMSHTATTQAAFEEDSSQQRLLLEESPLSSDQENCSEDNKHNDEPPQEDEGFMGMSPLLQAHHAMERMEEFVCKMHCWSSIPCVSVNSFNPQVWEGRWRVIPHDVLPDWLKDNDYLLHGHRPPMPSFRACFKSIFRIHTETGNIWTHLLGTLGLL